MRRSLALPSLLGLFGAGLILTLVPETVSAQPYRYGPKKFYYGGGYCGPPRRYYRARRFSYGPAVGFGLTFNIPNTVFQSRPQVQYGNWQTVQERQPDPLVRDVQDRLARLGYPVGEVDGYYGPQTANALRLFQQDAGLPVNGQISDDVVAALGAQGSNSGGPVPPSTAPSAANLPTPPANAAIQTPPNSPATSKPAMRQPSPDSGTIDLDKAYPKGIPSGQKGFVKSPYAQDQGLIDVQVYPKGTLVRCPYTQKIFEVP